MKKNIDNNGFTYVDLGLPSGTLWATMNVGANKASEYGLYFQWADAQGYSKEQVGKDKNFELESYKYCFDEDSEIFNKYRMKGEVLQLEDDAAHAFMGGDWHMPSPEQINELIYNTTTEWTSFYGVNGMKFISKKNPSKYIFIPAAGYAVCSNVWLNEQYGYLWTSKLSSVSDSYGQFFFFDSKGTKIRITTRGDGFSVRGVIG